MSWRTVSIAAGLVSLGAVTVAVIVSSIRDVDTLSVVALGLAVVAFVIQIITYIVQAASAARQERDAIAINGSTLRALALIEEKAEATRQVVDTMNQRVVGAIIDKVSVEQAVSSDKSDSEPSIEIRRAFTSAILSGRKSPSAAPFSSGSFELMSRDASMSETPTGTRLRAAIDALAEAPEDRVWTIRRLGKDQARTGGSPPGTPFGPGVRSLRGAQELYKAGIVRRVSSGPEGAPVFVLTELGKDVARVLLSDDDNLLAYPAVVNARKRIANLEELSKAMEESTTAYPEIPIENI